MFEKFVKKGVEKAVETAKVEVMDVNTQKNLAESVTDNMIPVIVQGTTEAIKKEVKKTIIPWAIGIIAFGIFTYAVSHKTIVIRVLR
jgi:hypothetical protein